MEPAHYLIRTLAFFAYWTFFESTRGQSIGEMALKLRTVNLAGEPADIVSVAVQSFGKAFLLPVDVILRWIFTNEKRQRIFNRISRTVVTKVRDEGRAPGNVRYRKD